MKFFFKLIAVAGSVLVLAKLAQMLVDYLYKTSSSTTYITTEDMDGE